MNFTKEEIVIGNVKIAKFLGWKIDNSFPDKERIYRSPKNEIELDTTLKFNTSFDLLIPVFTKIHEWNDSHIEETMTFNFNLPVFHVDRMAFWLSIINSIDDINMLIDK